MNERRQQNRRYYKNKKTKITKVNKNNEKILFGKVSEIIRLKNLNIIVIFTGEKEVELIDLKNVAKNINIDDFVKTKVIYEENKENPKIKEIEKLTINHPFISIYHTKKVRRKENRTLIKSPIYEQLYPAFLKAKEIIENAIIERRLIIIRHHFDCDGYSGAITLEKAITLLAAKYGRNENAIRQHLRRIPCPLPFYDLDEAISDISAFLDNPLLEREPLLILIDNGSTNEDLLGLQKLKIYNFKVVVIDHHVPAKEKNNFAVDKLSEVHINPYKVGGDSNITAGMLSSELANILHQEVKDLECLAALSGVADHSSCLEFNQYLKLANKKGCTLEYLQKLAKVIDYITSSIRKKESKTFVENLFNFQSEIQRKTIDLIYPELIQFEKNRINVIEHFMKIINKKDKTIILFNLEETIKRNSYPGSGKSAGLLLDKYKEKYEKIAVIAYSQDSIVIRTNNIEKDINNFIIEEKNKKPYIDIEGGGHKNAASIRFIKKANTEVLKDLITWLTKDE